MADYDHDIIVVGAGPVGLATALGLARQGLRPLILERAAELNTMPRAMAYLYPCLEALEHLGVLPDLKEQAFVGTGCGFIDFRTDTIYPQTLTVLDGHVAHPYALQLGQGDVGRILLRHLAAYNVEIRWNTKVTGLAQDPSGVTLTTTTPGSAPLRARYVVAADGASSTLRDLLHLEFKGFTWPDRFVSTNLRYDFTLHGLPDASWRIDKTYGAVIARIDKTGLWRYTFRESDDLPLEGLEERIHEHFKGGLYGGGYELVQFAPYRMHQRCVDNFRHGRVLLAGDAAHVTNPIGGLGLTGGFMDAYVLQDALGAVVQGRVGEEVLDLYA
ncbi:FAD-dependent monooxygenase, partial [Staphylotrichum tortipilum]